MVVVFREGMLSGVEQAPAEEVIVDGLRSHKPQVHQGVVRPEVNKGSLKENSTLVHVGDGKASIKAGRKKTGQGGSQKILGPYAPLVHELLTETIFENRLVKLGILAPDETLQLSLLKALPAQLPAHGRITSKFGNRKSPFSKRIVHHNGVDVAVARGSKVKSTGDGTVVYSGWYGGYGKLIEIDHGFGIVSRYGHNQRLLVDVGDRVTRGQAVALAGSSGRSTGPHIHYEVLIHGQEVDPIEVMFPDTRVLIAKEEAEYKRRMKDRSALLAGDTDQKNLDQIGFEATEIYDEEAINYQTSDGSSIDERAIGGDEDMTMPSVVGEPPRAAFSNIFDISRLIESPFWINFFITSAFLTALFGTIGFMSNQRLRLKWIRH